MILKNVIIFFCLCVSTLSCHSKVITLEDALNVYVYHTSYVKTRHLAFLNAIMEYENFRKSFLPSLSLNLTPLSFDHSMRLLQNYNNGEYSNVEEFSSTSSFGLNISQKVALTGGTFSLGSNISFLREFSNQSNSFSTSPLYFSYTQPLLGGGKSSRYDKSIHKLRYDMALSNYCTSVSTEQNKILQLYLDAYSCMKDVEYYALNVDIGDTVLYYAQQKMNMGKITEYEYNQFYLQQLSNKIELEKSQSAYSSSLRLISSELSTHDVEIDELTDIVIPEFLDDSEVKQYVKCNNPQYQELELEKLNAEYTLYQTELNNRFNASISLSYGINQYGKTFVDAYSTPNQRQGASITLSIPVFQWGINKNKIRIAKNNYESTLLMQKSSVEDFEENVTSCVTQFNVSRRLLELAQRKYEMCSKQYSLMAMRYNLGKISSVELLNAGKDFLQAKLDFLSTKNSAYTNYFAIRHLSLHDFVQRKDLVEIIRKSVEV